MRIASFLLIPTLVGTVLQPLSHSEHHAALSYQRPPLGENSDEPAGDTAPTPEPAFYAAGPTASFIAAPLSTWKPKIEIGSGTVSDLGLFSRHRSTTAGLAAARFRAACHL